MRSICVVGQKMKPFCEFQPSPIQCIFLESPLSLDCIAKEHLQYEDLSSTMHWLTYFAEMSFFLPKIA